MPTGFVTRFHSESNPCKEKTVDEYRDFWPEFKINKKNFPLTKTKKPKLLFLNKVWIVFTFYFMHILLIFFTALELGYVLSERPRQRSLQDPKKDIISYFICKLFQVYNFPYPYVRLFAVRWVGWMVGRSVGECIIIS